LLFLLLAEGKAPAKFLEAVSLNLSPAFVKQVASTPDDVDQDVEVQEAEVGATHTEKEHNVKEGVKASQLYSSCQAALLALLNERNILAMSLFHHVLKPFRNNHTLMQEALRGGPVKVQNWYINLALGQQFKVMSEIWGVSSDMAALVDIGLLLEVTDASIDLSLPDDPCVLEQDNLAKELDHLCCSLVMEFCKDACASLHLPISLAAALRSPHAQDVDHILKNLSEIWSAWNTAKLQTGPTIRALVARSPLQGVLEQDLLAELAQVDFQICTDKALQISDAIFLSLGSSLACELGFQVWEGGERRGQVRVVPPKKTILRIHLIFQLLITVWFLVLFFPSLICPDRE
jgi:hypothetical protein